MYHQVPATLQFFLHFEHVTLTSALSLCPCLSLDQHSSFLIPSNPISAWLFPSLSHTPQFKVSPLEKPLPFCDHPVESLPLLVLFPFDPICLKLSFLHTCSLIHGLSSQDRKPYKSRNFICLTYCHICST